MIKEFFRLVRLTIAVAVGVALGLLLGGLAWRGIWLPVDEEVVTRTRV